MYTAYTGSLYTACIDTYRRESERKRASRRRREREKTGVWEYKQIAAATVAASPLSRCMLRMTVRFSGTMGPFIVLFLFSSYILAFTCSRQKPKRCERALGE